MTTIIPDQPLPRRSESGMATRKVNAAAGVVLAAMKAGRQTPTSIAIALDSACLLNSPEQAAELERLRTEREKYVLVPHWEHELMERQRERATAAEARVAELEEQRERRRVRLAAAEADLLNMRGLLSPNGERRRIPAEVEIHERVAPAVEWLLNRVAELEKERNGFRDQRNAVFATNEQLHAQVEEAGLARIQAENEARTLRARLAELKARLAEAERPVDEDPVPYALTDKADAVRAEDDVTPQVLRLRALLAGQREDVAAEADGITRRIAPVQALRLERGADK